MSLRPCIAKLCTLNGLAARRPGVFVVQRRAVPPARFTFGARTASSSQQGRETGILKQLKEARERIDRAIAGKDINDLSYSISLLRKLVYTLPSSLRPQASQRYIRFTSSHVDSMVGILASRNRKEDAESLECLIRDCKDIYDVEVDEHLLQTVLKALVQTNQSIVAYELINRFRGLYSPVRPNSAHWRTVMKGLAVIGDSEKIEECLTIMKSGWPFPSATHYQALLESMLRRPDPPSVDEINKVLDEMRSYNMPYDSGIASVLDKFQKQWQECKGLVSAYRAVDRPRPTATCVQKWIEGLARARRRKAKASFELKLSQLRQKGFSPDERIFSKLVGLLPWSTVEELQYLQEVLEVKANIIIWSILIKDILAKSGVQEALKAYKAAKDSGIQPDAAIVHPILRVMCNARVREPTEAVLDQALELYEDINTQTSSERSTPEREREREPQKGADTGIYNTLLRALAASSNTSKYFPIALRLLEDMRAREIRMDPMTSTSITILLIRSSGSFAEAAEVYRHLRTVDAGALDEKGFTAVLHAFCSLSVPDSSVEGARDSDNEAARLAIPPAKEYFQIVRDMRAQGYPKTAQVYTILLGRYAALATRVRAVADAQQRSALFKVLRGVIEETHRQFTVDAGLAPDAPLLNQLMDAYNRAGAMNGVLQVWSTLNSTALVSNASVSIVFDACGYNRARDRADEIFRDLRKAGFPLNRRNWNAYVECLCRLDRLGDAVRAVCHDMPEDAGKDSRPDEDTIRILLSFASKSGHVEDVRSYVKMRLPALWDSLPDDMRN